MIEKLEKWASDSCTPWFDLSLEDQDAFLEEYATYVDAHPEETEAYLQKQELCYLGTLNIAFEGISRFSSRPEVMLPTVKKILDHSYGNEYSDLDYMEPLDDMDTIELFFQYPEVYMQHMDLLASRLRPEKDPKYLIKLLQVFDLAFFNPEEDHSGSRYIRKKWFDNIEELANYGSPLELKLKAREVIKSSGQNCNLISLTWGERIRSLFGK